MGIQNAVIESYVYMEAYDIQSINARGNDIASDGIFGKQVKDSARWVEQGNEPDTKAQTVSARRLWKSMETLLFKGSKQWIEEGTAST